MCTHTLRKVQGEQKFALSKILTENETVHHINDKFERISSTSKRQEKSTVVK